jgi:hypothetical protein
MALGDLGAHALDPVLCPGDRRGLARIEADEGAVRVAEKELGNAREALLAREIGRASCRERV